MDLKHFFDFQKCWDEIIIEYRNDESGEFDDDILEDIPNGKVATFIKNQIPLNNEECEIEDAYITFCFSEEYQTANESNNQNEYFVITIEYNWVSETFTHYSQEQG